MFPAVYPDYFEVWEHGEAIPELVDVFSVAA
jgi:hypothetical protein